MNVTLARTFRGPNLALGVLRADDHVLVTLERPWLNNEPNISCIYPGQYECRYLPRSGSGKYRRVWHLQDVPGRSGILIHHGNLVRHTRGCILVGLRHGYLGGERAVLSSKSAMAELLDVIGTNDFTLTIGGSDAGSSDRTPE